MLIAKTSESLNGSTALYLRLTTKDNNLLLSRENELPAESDMITRRYLFSVFGSLAGH